MNRALTLLLVGSVSLAFAPQTSATIQDPVRVHQGQLSGATDEKTSVRVYRGIPYATPPVGNLRWKPPQPAAHWTGVHKATEFSNGCMQFAPPGIPELAEKNAVVKRSSQSEDCLYLNVWTPANSASDKLPVMFWIHGGGFTIGAGSQPLFTGENLARKDVVVVTINYRLGVFGFFALPELTAESPHHASGNYGLMDQIAALQWVKENIASFGGDPGNITIFGESAGSWAVNLLTASPLAKGLFQRAIGESGATFAAAQFHPMVVQAEAEKTGEKLAVEMGVTQQVLKTLRAKPAEDLMEATASSYPIAWAIVDGWVLPQSVETIYAQGKQNDVPIILGNNADESTNLMPRVASAAQFVTEVKQRYGDMASEFLKAYPAESDEQATESAYAAARDEGFGWNMREWARMQTRTGHHAAYRYYFSHRAPGPEGQRLGAFHALDLPYVFGHFILPFPWEDADRRLSETMMSYWTNFAKAGDPNGLQLPKWLAYNPADDNALEIGDSISMRTHINQAGLDFFDAYHRALASTRSAGSGAK